MNRSVEKARENDRLLADVLERIAERVHEGQRVDLQCYVDQYPQLAGELRQLLPAMDVLADFAGPASFDGSSRLPIETDSESESHVLGDFRIRREIGRGGMGVVYEAEQISLERRVALKVLPCAAVLDKRTLARFATEARAAGGLHHTNIVPVYSVGCERGVHYIEFDASGEHLIVGGFFGLKMYRCLERTNTSGGQPELSLEEIAQLSDGWCYRHSISRDGKLLAFYRYDQYADTDYSPVPILDLRGGRLRTSVIDVTISRHDLHFLSSGHVLLYVTPDKRLAAWDADMGKTVFALGEPGDFRDIVMLSPDNRLVAAPWKPRSKKVAIWDLQQQQPLVLLPGGGMPLSWSNADNQIAVSQTAGEVDIWDLEAVRIGLHAIGLGW